VWKHALVPARPVPGRRGWCGLIALATVLLTACAGSPSGTGATSSTTMTTTRTTTTAAGTQEVRFAPYGAQGALLPTERVTLRVAGTCVAPGVAGTSSYRCFAQPHSTIYDPCFAPPRATSGPLECVADPSAPEAVEFDTGPLPAAPAGAPVTRPWAVQLPNGQICILVAAAWDGLGPFACPTPGAVNSVADCHVPDQATPWWSTACQAQENTTSPYGAVRVVKVWT